MRSILLIVALAVPALAQADIIKCHFTEPFYTTTYSMVQQSLTIESADGPTRVIHNVSFQILGPAKFELWDRNRNVLQSMDLNFNGSDGMSDNVYPYEVEWKSRNLFGGCTSNFLHATSAAVR